MQVAQIRRYNQSKKLIRRLYGYEHSRLRGICHVETLVKGEQNSLDLRLVSLRSRHINLPATREVGKRPGRKEHYKHQDERQANQDDGEKGSVVVFVKHRTLHP